MKKKTLSFDSFIAENAKQTISVTAFGETVEVKAEIPAIVPMLMARAELEEDDGATTRAMLNAADALFGKQTINRWCAKGMSVNELSRILTSTFNAINGTEDSEDDDVEELDDESGVVAEKKAKK